MKNDNQKTIEVSGKKIEFGTMNDEKILKLYDKLLERNNVIIRKINEVQMINDVNINNI